MRADAEPADLKVLLRASRARSAPRERDPAVWRHFVQLVVNAFRA